MADGELVIINDRYGVKISKVTADEFKEDASIEGMVNFAEKGGANVSIAPNSNVKTGGEEAPAADGGDEFDYSDFDVEE